MGILLTRLRGLGLFCVSYDGVVLFLTVECKLSRKKKLPPSLHFQAFVCNVKLTYLFFPMIEGMSLEGNLQILSYQATRQWGGLGFVEVMWNGVLWGLTQETTPGEVKQWLVRPEFWMWYTMPPIMSWSVLKLWWRVPLFRLMQHHSSSGISSIMVLTLVARRRLQLLPQPRKKERYNNFFDQLILWVRALCLYFFLLGLPWMCWGIAIVVLDMVFYIFLISLYIYISILILFILWNRRIICVNQLYQEEHKSICMYGKVIVTIIILFGQHQIFRT